MPIFLFCNTSQEHLKHIDTIQKGAGKLVSGTIRCTSSDAICEELSWQRISDRRQNHMTILHSNIIHHRAPSYLLTHIPITVENLFLNNLKENIKHLEKMPPKTHLTKHKPKCKPNLGNRQLSIIMARLRMRCSELRQHLFDMNIIENNNCECGLPETTSHVFFSNAHCTLFLGVFYVISFCVIIMNLLIMLFYMASVAGNKYFYFFHRKRSLDYTFVLLQLLIKYVYTNVMDWVQTMTDTVTAAS